MKRTIACLLAILLAVALAACDPVDTGPTGTKAEQNRPTLGQDSLIQSTDETLPDAVKLEEIPVVDNEYCTIKITGVEEDTIWGYTLSVYLENRSPDKTFMFSVDAASINGVYVQSLFASEVAPGKKANESITFIEDDLKANGITSYTDIQLDFRVYDTNDWTADDVANATAHVYPFGEENAVTFLREPKSEDIILVDNDQVTVIVTGFRDDELWGYTADLYILNKTDVSIMVSADEVSVNGFMVDPFFATTVPAGKCGFSAMSWSDSDFESNGITTVENIEFTLRVYDENDWLGDDFVNQQISLKP